MDLQTIFLLAFVAVVAYLTGRLVTELRMRARERHIRKDAAQRSRAVLGGQFSEQLAPYLPGFPYRPTEVKFLGKPTDFIVFEGLDDKEIRSVVFVEVKSGDSHLNGTERSLRSAIENGKVRFETYRVPKDLTG